MIKIWFKVCKQESDTKYLLFLMKKFEIFMVKQKKMKETISETPALEVDEDEYHFSEVELPEEGKVGDVLDFKSKIKVYALFNMVDITDPAISRD